MSDRARGRWAEEDLALLRTLGGRMSQIILGEDVDVPDLQRRDELGILANLVSRLASELRARRRRDQEQRRELERRVEELSAAYETQDKLLGTIRSSPSPILDLHEGILLAPITGTLDATRVSFVVRALVEHIAAKRTEVVILHLASPDPVGAEAAAMLLRAAQSLRQAGARTLLSGLPLPHPPSLAALTPCETLPEALTAALDLIGYRITR